MSKKRDRRAQTDYGMAKTEVPCREPIEMMKARYHRAKEQFETIVDLAMEDAIHYDYKNEIVGQAYMAMYYQKQELKRRKETK